MTNLLDYILLSSLGSLTKNNIIPQSLFDRIIKFNDIKEYVDSVDMDNFMLDINPYEYFWYTKTNGEWRLRLVNKFNHMVIKDGSLLGIFK